MAFRPSPYFNSPAFSQAAANLAGLFAPPSGSDVAGWATARAKQEEAARLAQLFDLAQAEEFNQERFDRMGIAAGQWNPNQSYYRVDRDNATQRYGIDVGAATSRDNNIRDNQRQAVTSLFRALNPGQIAPEVPDEFMAVLGLPAVAERSGLPPMPSETQWQAEQNQRLLDQGDLTDEMLVDMIMGQRSPVTAVGPDGRPTFMSPGAAVREGAEAHINPGQLSPRMYRTPDGRTGVTHDGGLTDAHSGAALAQGTQLSTTSDTTETFGGPELRGHRDEILGRRAAIESVIRQANAINETLQSTETGSAIGFVGSSARIINDLASQVQAVASMSGIEFDPNIRDVTGYRDLFRSLGVDNATVQSALVDLAYTVAQSRKPGRLNQDDIRQALVTIGGNLQDPQALRQVLNSAVQRSIADYDAYESTMRSQFGDELRLAPSNFTPLTGARMDRAPAAPEGQGPQPGTIEDGYRFRGGDPADRNNWERVQ